MYGIYIRRGQGSSDRDRNQFLNGMSRDKITDGTADSSFVSHVGSRGMSVICHSNKTQSFGIEIGLYEVILKIPVH